MTLKLLNHFSLYITETGHECLFEKQYNYEKKLLTRLHDRREMLLFFTRGRKK